MAIFQNDFGSTSLLSSELPERMQVLTNQTVQAANDHREHLWVTVIDPTNQRSLLQACDDCGVVKSENSVIRNCKADFGVALISNSAMANVKMTG